MSEITLFSTVTANNQEDYDFMGEMVVIEIRTPEQAAHYGSYEIICRSLVNGNVVDFKETELTLVEE